MRCQSIAIPLVLLAAIGAGPAAAIEVDNSGDGLVADCTPGSGLCTLRQAILDANAALGGSIELPAGVVYQLSQGPLPINPGGSNTVTITVVGGPSPLDTAIDGDANGRVFDVQTGTLDLTGVTVRNGDAGAGFGGGVSVASNATLVLTDAVVTGNAATHGGGISVAGGGAADLLRVIVSGNQVTHATAVGGGIRNDGELVLTSVTVSGNFGTIQLGGGIFNVTPGTLASDASAIIGNAAASLEGGGLWSSSTATMPESSIAECDDATGAVCLVDTAISSNAADDGGGYHHDAGSFDLIRGRISTNVASSDGAGLHVAAGSGSLLGVEVSGNDAAGAGGGIQFLSAGTLDVDQSRIESNLANSGAGLRATSGTVNVRQSQLLGNTADVSGGGVQLAGNATTLIEDTTIADNRAAQAASNGDGAGLWTSENTTVRRSTIAYNVLTQAGATDTGAYGGGIFVFGGVQAIQDSTISGNIGGFGGGIGSNGTGTLSLVNTTLVLNTSTVTSGVVGENLHHSVAYPTTIRNSIVARAPGADDGNCNNLSLASPNSGFNLRENAEPSCGFNSTDDRTFSASDLGALQDNGGLVETHALLGGPGVDAANDAICSTHDNREFIRTSLLGLVVNCDMGSFEIEALPEPGLQASLALGIVLLVALSRARASRARS
jgi:hypothetical protein